MFTGEANETPVDTCIIDTMPTGTATAAVYGGPNSHLLPDLVLCVLAVSTNFNDRSTKFMSHANGDGFPSNWVRRGG